MIENSLKIVNKLGLHARPAAQVVKISSKYENCKIFLFKNKEDSFMANGKSIMSVMMLAAEYDSLLTIRCQGEGAKECLEELCNLVNSGFGED